MLNGQIINSKHVFVDVAVEKKGWLVGSILDEYTAYSKVRIV